MKSKHVQWIAFAALAFSTASCGKSGAGDSAGESDNNARIINVKVETLKTAPFVETLSLTGTIKALHDVLIAPEEGGTVVEWLVEKGKPVQEGAVLVQLNDDMVRPAYEAALAQYNTAELTYQKQQSVFEELAVSEWQLKTSQYARDAARAQADLMKARLEKTKVRSPISGVLEDRMREAGELAAPGVPVARVVNSGRIKVRINVPERFAGAITLGSGISFSVMAYPGETFAARLTHVGSAISPDNRTFIVEAEMLNPNHKLKPEMIARVTLYQSKPRPALLVPEEVVQQVDRNKQVVFIEEEGFARERIVVLGGHDGNHVEVRSGLAEGERIIVSGYQLVADGHRVAVVE